MLVLHPMAPSMLPAGMASCGPPGFSEAPWKLRGGLGAELKVPALDWYFPGVCNGSCTLVPASCQG